MQFLHRAQPHGSRRTASQGLLQQGPEVEEAAGDMIYSTITLLLLVGGLAAAAAVLLVLGNLVTT